MNPLILIGGGALLAIILRAKSVATNVNQEHYSSSAGTSVPFAQAGNAQNPNGSFNYKTYNPNAVGQGAASETVINVGSQSAVIAQNFQNSNAASMGGSEWFQFLDPTTGVQSTRGVVWGAKWNSSGLAAITNYGTGYWVKQPWYVANPSDTMSGCPQPPYAPTQAAY